MSAELFQTLARQCAAYHRLGMLGQGGETLARFVDTLGGELAREPSRGAQLAATIAELLAAQERGDPIGLADRLEYELLPRLGR